MHSLLLAARFTSDSASTQADACAIWRCIFSFGTSKADVDTYTDMASARSDLWHVVEATSARSHPRRMVEAYFVLQAYFMLDEMLLAGELQEPSKKAVTRVIEVQVHSRAQGPYRSP